MVGARGFEPPASWSRTRRASQAALRPDGGHSGREKKPERGIQNNIARSLNLDRCAMGDSEGWGRTLCYIESRETSFFVSTKRSATLREEHELPFVNNEMALIDRIQKD